MKDYTEVSPEIIHRYNRSGPRYTSYPTVPIWDNGQFSEDYTQFLAKEGESDSPISLYLHIPFCSRLCTFCGCHRFITKKSDIVEDYLDALGEELKLTAQHLGTRKSVKQLHLGGGTPTHLSIAQLERLHGMISKHFDFEPVNEMALEAHPRVTSKAQLEALYNLGFRRVSFGVQDTDTQVQHAINREQTVEQTLQTFNVARELGYSSINIDLVYGLPCQTVDTFQRSMETVNELRPDRLAIYSFAYIPGMFKTHARAIQEDDLPSTEEKVAIYVSCIKFFTQAGYRMIGMDHYALPDDELTLAQDNQTLHRNFMGYTTFRGMSQIGVGASAISDFGNGFFQNEKDTKTYIAQVKEGTIGTIRRRVLDTDDLLRREVIETLMCQCQLSIPQIEKEHGISFKTYFAEEWQAMESFVDEGMVELDSDQIRLTPLGTLFMRNVVMPFDRYLKGKSETPHFSKTV